MKRGSPDRNWDAAIDKCRNEGECRVCHVQRGLDCCHLAPRKHDKPKHVGQKRLFVHPDNCIPLCAHDHYEFDAGQLDVLEYLTLDEQLHVVRVLGGIERARMRLAPLDYRRDIQSARVVARLEAA